MTRESRLEETMQQVLRELDMTRSAERVARCPAFTPRALAPDQLPCGDTHFCGACRGRWAYRVANELAADYELGGSWWALSLTLSGADRQDLREALKQLQRVWARFWSRLSALARRRDEDHFRGCSGGVALDLLGRTGNIHPHAHAVLHLPRSIVRADVEAQWRNALLAENLGVPHRRGTWIKRLETARELARRGYYHLAGDLRKARWSLGDDPNLLRAWVEACAEARTARRIGLARSDTWRKNFDAALATEHRGDLVFVGLMGDHDAPLLLPADVLPSIRKKGRVWVCKPLFPLDPGITPNGPQFDRNSSRQSGCRERTLYSAVDPPYDEVMTFWTNSRVRVFLDLVGRGLEVKEIAEEFGVSPWFVSVSLEEIRAVIAEELNPTPSNRLSEA